MIDRPKIRLHQVWKQKGHKVSVIIMGKRGGKWMAKTLGDKIGTYRDTHRLSEFVIYSKHELI